METAGAAGPALPGSALLRKPKWPKSPKLDSSNYWNWAATALHVPVPAPLADFPASAPSLHVLASFHPPPLVSQMQDAKEATAATTPYPILPGGFIKTPSPPSSQVGTPGEFKPAPAPQKAAQLPRVCNLSDFIGAPASVQGMREDRASDAYAHRVLAAATS